MNSRQPDVDAELERLQRETFDYFLHETNPVSGLVIDKAAAHWPASIAATGLALACYPVSVERGFMPRASAVERTLATLRFFWSSPQGPEPDATRYTEFFYHFLDMQTGRRAWQRELLTVDSAFLLASALTAGSYFYADHFELNQGPIVLMIESHRTGLLWGLMKNCPYIVSGLRQAGFSGGWL